MNLHRLLPITTLLLGAASAVSAPPVIPANGTECDGYVIAEAAVPGDSVADLSWAAAYGDAATWRYVTQGDTAYAELRGDSWRAYRATGDTLRLIHSETSSERTDLRMSAIGVGERPYLARSRRQMAFCYLDSGTVSTTEGLTPLLILSEGDTVRDCPYRETTARYLRYALDEASDSVGAPVGAVEDTERVWALPGSATPLAVTSVRTVEAPGREPSTTAATWVFPRDAAQPAVTGGASPMGAAPPATLEGATLTVGSPRGADITVCDLSGRVWLTSHSPDGTLDLTGLPPGAYVVSVSRGGQPRESTVIMLE